MASLPSLKAFGFDLKRPADLLQLILLLLVFSVALLTGTWDLGNSRIVMYHQLVFIAAFALLQAWRVAWLPLIRDNRWILVLTLAWVVSVSVSFYTSPLNLQFLTVAQFRYAETLVHIFFFLSLYVSNQLSPLPIRKILIAIVFSNALVVVHAFLTWHYSPEPNVHTESMWSNYFPMSGNIRHAGFNMLVAVAAAIGLVFSAKNKVDALLGALGLLLVCGCLVWLGGRGSMLSLIIGISFAWWVVSPKVFLWKKAAVIGSVLLSVVLAEQLSQFKFNGLRNSVSKSVAAEDFNRLSSGRLVIWQDSMEKLEGHWVMGFGSQAYLMLPDRVVRKTSSPHNVFVQFLLEWGVIGTLLFSALFATLLYNIACVSTQLHGQSERGLVFSASAIVVALSAHGLTDGTFYHGKASFYLALAAALCFAFTGRQNLAAADK